MRTRGLGLVKTWTDIEAQALPSNSSERIVDRILDTEAWKEIRIEPVFSIHNNDSQRTLTASLYGL
jgi:hypothetical protein